MKGGGALSSTSGQNGPHRAKDHVMNTIANEIQGRHSAKGRRRESGRNASRPPCDRRILPCGDLRIVDSDHSLRRACLAHADLGNNAPNISVAGYGVAAGTTVVCDPATHTMSVTGRTS